MRHVEKRSVFLVFMCCACPPPLSPPLFSLSSSSLHRAEAAAPPSRCRPPLPFSFRHPILFEVLIPTDEITRAGRGRVHAGVRNSRGAGGVPVGSCPAGRLAQRKRHCVSHLFSTLSVMPEAGTLLHKAIAAALAAGFFIGLPTFMAPRWDAFSDALASFVHASDKESAWFYAFSIFTIHMCVLIFNNSLLSLSYIGVIPLEQWKINPRPWPWKDPKSTMNVRSLILRSIATTLFNNLAFALPMSFGNHWLAQMRGYTASASAFPSPWEVFWQLCVFMVLEDTVFFWSHYTLHKSKWLYKHIHKQHHEWYQVLGFASEFAHPVEFILGNALPFAVGPVLLGAHNFTTLMWTIWRITETNLAHSNYELPWMPYALIPFTGGATAHEEHHSINTGNYSTFFNWWDVMMGTVIQAGGARGAAKAAAKASKAN